MRGVVDPGTSLRSERESWTDRSLLQQNENRLRVNHVWLVPLIGPFLHLRQTPAKSYVDTSHDGDSYDHVRNQFAPLVCVQ